MGFWARVDINGSCWNWSGATLPNGYGSVYEGGTRKNTRGAHQVAFEIYNARSIAPGKQIDHLCRNRQCVNPLHLEEVSCRVNILRGYGLAAQNAVKTHCISDHELAGDNLRINRDGSRACKTCAREATRRMRARRAA
jgi:hypothetical protein